jgi:hypothetical protein
MSTLFADGSITFIDASIIGGPPHLRPDNTWYRPTIALSGSGTRDIHLDDVFDVSHVGPEIGQASALKMSFASLSKVNTNANSWHANLHRDLQRLPSSPSEQRMRMDF